MDDASNIWPKGSPGGDERKLLDFTSALIIDLARTHPRVIQQQVAEWIAQVVIQPRTER